MCPVPGRPAYARGRGGYRRPMSASVPDDRPGPTDGLGGESPDPPDAAWSLGRLSILMHAVTTRFAAREELHLTDVTAISVLVEAGRSMTAGELGTSLELSSGATTRLVDRLETIGHLARQVDPTDRRRRMVSVTDTAMATAGAFFGQLGHRVNEVLARYEPDEQAIIARFLAEVVEAMRELPSHPSDPQGSGPTGPVGPDG